MPTARITSHLKTCLPAYLSVRPSSVSDGLFIAGPNGSALQVVKNRSRHQEMPTSP